MRWYDDRGGQPRILDWDRIGKLRREGKTYRAIAKELGCAYSSVHYICSQLAIGLQKPEVLPMSKNYSR